MPARTSDVGPLFQEGYKGPDGKNKEGCHEKYQANYQHGQGRPGNPAGEIMAKGNQQVGGQPRHRGRNGRNPSGPKLYAISQPVGNIGLQHSANPVKHTSGHNKG